MNKDAKIKALTYFANKPNDDDKANEFLNKEFEKVSNILNNKIEYSKLELALKFLNIFAFRYSERATPLLINFINRMAIPDSVTSDVPMFNKYSTAESLQVEALDVLMRLRFLQIDLILDFLLSTYQKCDNKLKNKAVEGIKQISEYDISVLEKIGYSAQLAIIERFEKLNSGQLLSCKELLFSASNKIFTNDIDVHEWQYRTVSIKTYPIQCNSVFIDLRERCLELLFNLYKLSQDTNDKLLVISELNNVKSAYSRTPLSDDFKELITKNTIEIISFYKSLIDHEDFSILQKIEHDSYWTFYHAINPEIRQSAIEIESLLLGNEEYNIYRYLVGYESIFGSWEDNINEHYDYSEQEEIRKLKVEEFIQNVTEMNFDLWKQRILVYSAGGNNYSHFLGEFIFKLAQKLPESVLQFIQNTKKTSPILSNALRGLSQSKEHQKCEELVLDWIDEGSYLFEISGLLTNLDNMDQKVFIRYFEAVINSKDEDLLINSIRVLTSNLERLSVVFIDMTLCSVIEILTEKNNVRWVENIWFMKNINDIVQKLTPKTIDQILTNLTLVKSIDYRVEGVIVAIGQLELNKLYDWFDIRLDKQEADKTYKYDAIPYNLHKLADVLKSDINELVSRVIGWYGGNYGLFIHRGAELISKVFPVITPELTEVLKGKLVTGEENDNLILLAILRSYDGHESTLPIVAKLIEAIDSSDKILNEVRIILSATGVVSGEYGFVRAYEVKKELVQDWLNSTNDKLLKFTLDYIDYLDESIKSEQQRAEEREVIMKHQYGYKDEEKGAE